MFAQTYDKKGEINSSGLSSPNLLQHQISDFTLDIIIATVIILYYIVPIIILLNCRIITFLKHVYSTIIWHT